MFVCKFHVPKNVISTIHTILHWYWYQLSTRAHFQNWVNTFLSSWPILELYPSIFLHKQIFANCTITVLILFSYFIVFPPILLGMYSYTFYPQLFLGQFLRIVMLHFLMQPIFRTGLMHFCHPSPFWHCILPFFYISQSLELYNSSCHSNLEFHSFPANTFSTQIFPIQFHKIILLHFSTAVHFLNWTNTLLSSGPISELYPSIFPHKPIFGTVPLHLSLYFLNSWLVSAVYQLFKYQLHLLNL